MNIKTDLFKEYLEGEIKDFLFSELDPSFLAANDLAFLENIPVPIKKDDLKDFTENGLSTTKLADNMAFVIGADNSFKYCSYYIRFFKKLFNDNIVNVFISKAEALLSSSEYRKAMCYLRAAKLLDPTGLNAMFCYANGCRIWYQSMEGEDFTELISTLKSEANLYFAQTTNMYPEFAPAWYFLAYAYLNSGSYTKAELAFNHYLKQSEGQPEEDIKEVNERLADLKDPVIIEHGRDLLMAGNAQEAIEILSVYTEGKYSRWWPLYFYLGAGYEQLGNDLAAIENYRNVLKYNPSNYDAMISLSELYQKTGQEELAGKYSEKAKIILENINDND